MEPRPQRRAWPHLFAALVASGGASLAQEVRSDPGAALDERAHAFFRAECVRCHGPPKPKARLRLDELEWDSTDDAVLARWQKVLDRLTAGEMPPEGEPRPAPEAVEAMCTSIRQAFAALAEAPKDRVLRRLNRIQCRNTLRDLLVIDVRLDDPTDSFPPDETIEGFDVLAEGLVMSDFLLRQYLFAARHAIDLATFEGPRPEPEAFRMFDPDPRRASDFRVAITLPKWTERTRWLGSPAVLFLNDELAPGNTRGQVLTTSVEGARSAGWYEFTFEVESKGRRNALPGLLRERRPEWQVLHPDDLHRLEIYLSAPQGSSAVTSRRRILAEALDLPDDERLTLVRRYWLAPGWRVELAFGNAFAGQLEGYLKALGAGDEVKSVSGLPKPERLERLAHVAQDRVARTGAPRILIHAASGSGPFHESWPPPSQLAAWGDPAASLEEHVSDFARRAFRRPVAAEELARTFASRRGGPEGVRTALEAILCSPRFLYLLEPDGVLDDWALAARLSYFVWSTMPDEPLRALAAEGRLHEPDVLRAQAERMLADPRSSELVEQFTWSWLGLQNALDMAPDPVRFPEYHSSRQEAAAVAETRAFFRHVLDENRPVSEFITSDYTFVNADLARLYGIEGVHTTARFERVDLPAELQRGGLLGQASVLTTSANGVDTSPVVRGVWALTHLLGTPPDPPPPDVPIPEPDARGALSVRELFEKHRSIESCNACHRSIDPLGFALEPFDAIGRWRDAYETGARIETAGRMPDGSEFEDVGGMKQALLRELPLFTRNLTSKLAAYAAGRTMHPADRPEIDELVARALAPGFGLRDLVLSIVESRIFRRR